MSEKKHTPGPWKWDGHNTISTADGEQLTIVGASLQMGGDNREAKANARLIAAAPDLLAYAECEEAFRNDTASKPYLLVFLKHGYDPSSDDSPSEFLCKLRWRAISKAVPQ